MLIFEKLGVDYLFVDEADAYKNLFLFTKMNNVAGISNAASARASDLQLKIEYINELHGGDKRRSVCDGNAHIEQYDGNVHDADVSAKANA